MSEYNWCHGPECHKRKTTTRIRGVKGNKVLRTIKISLSSDYRRNSVYKYFCDQTCMHDFIREHIEQFVQLHPRPEALETPIEDPKRVRPYENYNWYNWEIKEVDNA
jgi:hypothetical protein